MALPYLPTGVSELPARRFVLFVDGSNKVQLMDESEKLADGESFTGEWVSPSLSRGDPSFLWTLTELHLWYTAEDDTTITVEASPDGGETWVNSREVSLEGGTDEVHAIHVPLRTTGDDLRVRVLFDSDTLVNLLGYRPWVLRRGGVRHAN